MSKKESIITLDSGETLKVQIIDDLDSMFLKKGSIEVRETANRQEVKRHKRLRLDLCTCENPEFLVYPLDGACSCGLFKHHVHCTCGAILQIG